jgi:hypothetical protein
MSVAQHDVGHLATRPPKRQDRRQIGADLNQQACRDDGIFAQGILRHPGDAKSNHPSCERALRPTARKYCDFYVALSTQSTGAIPRAHWSVRTPGSDSTTTERINGRRALRRRTDRRP